MAAKLRAVDISDTGARLVVEGPVNVLQAREFFLRLSSTGLAFRKCELVWIDGEQAGVCLIAKGPKKKTRSENSKTADKTTGPAPS